MRPKTSTVRACVDCGAILTKHGRSIRCLSCAAKERWKHYVRRGPKRVEAACEVCGATFFPRAIVVKSGAGRFCSRRCVYAFDRRRPLAERFWEKVAKGEGCWLWTGARLRGGYGTINAGGHAATSLLAHRVAYELVRGPIPDGLQIDHLCRNRACVNPYHMEPVSQAENLRRGRLARGLPR
jgi:hypothetical protein